MRWIGAASIAAVLLAGCGAPLSQPALAEPAPGGSTQTSLVRTSSADDSVTTSEPSPHTASSSAGRPAVTPESVAPFTGTTKTPVAVNLVATVALLNTLPVKGRAPKTGYDRALFGTAWTDDVTVAGGHNGCDTRNDILRRDLIDAVIKAGTYHCLVLSGTLHDPYTGRTIAFTRGQVTSQAVQIDHVVALMDAWQKGAQGLSMAERRNLANDPLNLQAVDGPTNERKGAGDAATWLPPNKEFRCTYVSRQVQVKTRYRLWVTQAEKDAIARVLTSCATSMTPSTGIPTRVGSAPSAVMTGTTPVTSARTSATRAVPSSRTPAPMSTSSSASSKAPQATTAAQPGDCYPRSKAGNCYRAGQTCAKASRGTSGVAANGRTITCVDDSGIWRWTYA